MSAKKSPIILTKTSTPFWDGIAKQKLLLQYDPAVNRYQFYPRPISLYSASINMEWRESSGRGTLVAFTLTRFPALGFEEELPYIEGIISLREGPRIFSLIRNISFNSLKVGLEMQVAFDDLNKLFYFIPYDKS